MCEPICGIHIHFLRYSASMRSIFFQRMKYSQRLKTFLPSQRYFISAQNTAPMSGQAQSSHVRGALRPIMCLILQFSHGRMACASHLSYGERKDSHVAIAADM